MRRRLPRQSDVRNAPGPSRSSRLRKQVHQTRATLRVPRQHRERLRLGDPDQLPGLGPVADVVAVAVDEQVRRRAVHELEPLLGHGLPVLGGHALAHDPAGDRDELVVDVGDALGVDAAADVGHLLRPPRGLDELVEVAHGSLLGRSPPACGVGSLLGRAQATWPATAVQVAGDDTLSPGESPRRPPGQFSIGVSRSGCPTRSTSRRRRPRRGRRRARARSRRPSPRRRRCSRRPPAGRSARRRRRHRRRPARSSSGDRNGPSPASSSR